MPLSSYSKAIPSQCEGQHSCPDLRGLHDRALGLETVSICDSKLIFFFFPLSFSPSHNILLPVPWSHHAHHLLWSLFLFFFSLWRIVDWPCCVTFKCAAKWISYTFTYICSWLFVWGYFPYRPIQCTELGLLCYRAGSYYYLFYIQ